MPVNADKSAELLNLAKSFTSSYEQRDRLSAALREHLGVTSRDSFYLSDDGVDDVLGPVVIYRFERDAFAGDGGAVKGLASSDDAFFRATFARTDDGYTFGEPVKVIRRTDYVRDSSADEGGDAGADETEVPEWLARALAMVAQLTKGAGHRYIRRVPKSGGGYRYFYKVSGGQGLGHEDEMKVGAKFRVTNGGKEGHFEVVGKDASGNLRIKHDESGHESTVSPAALKAMLHAEHAQSLDAHKAKLAADIKATDDPKAKARLLAEAGKYEHTRELAEPEKPGAKVLAFPTKGQPAAPAEKKPEPPKDRGFTGEKYDPKKSTADVAKELRETFKTALPKGVKVSVKTRTYSMGSSIDVSIKDAPFAILNPERVRWHAANSHSATPPREGPAAERYTPEGKALLDKVQSEMDKHNRNNSDSRTDYYDVAFSSHVDVDDEVKDRDRAAAHAAKQPEPANAAVGTLANPAWAQGPKSPSDAGYTAGHRHATARSSMSGADSAKPDNPHSPGSKDHSDWASGFAQGSKDAGGASRAEIAATAGDHTKLYNWGSTHEHPTANATRTAARTMSVGDRDYQLVPQPRPGKPPGFVANASMPGRAGSLDAKGGMSATPHVFDTAADAHAAVVKHEAGLAKIGSGLNEPRKGAVKVAEHEAQRDAHTKAAEGLKDAPIGSPGHAASMEHRDAARLHSLAAREWNAPYSVGVPELASSKANAATKAIAAPPGKGGGKSTKDSAGDGTRSAEWHEDMRSRHESRQDALRGKKTATMTREDRAAHEKEMNAHGMAAAQHRGARDAINSGDAYAAEISHRAVAVGKKAAPEFYKQPKVQKSMSTVTDPERDLAKSLATSHRAAAEAQPDAGAKDAHEAAAQACDAAALAGNTSEFRKALGASERIGGLIKAWSGIPGHQRPAFDDFRKSMTNPTKARPFAFSANNGTGDAMGQMGRAVAAARPAVEHVEHVTPEPTTYSAQRGAVNGLRKGMGAFYGQLAAGAAQQMTPGVRCPPEAQA